MDALKAAGILDDTIVVYTADHGEMRGEHGLWDKFVFYESSAGVPFVFRAPGVTKAGAVCEAPVSQVALVPTLLDLCGIPVPPGLMSRAWFLFCAIRIASKIVRFTRSFPWGARRKSI